jgi:glycerol-1-phosphate dehydrogenase [NAD(P)+]
MTFSQSSLAGPPRAPDESADHDYALLATALRAATQTRALRVGRGIRHDAAAIFDSQFGDRRAIVVADDNTWSAAGRDVSDSFDRANHATAAAFRFGPHVYADDRCVDELRHALAGSDAIPVAAGSGTINDLTKLAAHQVQRPYMVVATAASMDGYTAYGASITARGSKQTFDCPAPQAVLADLEVIAGAPATMNAAGYADLMAKVAAGADWIVADVLEIEPIDAPVWQMVHARLPAWLASPQGVTRGEPAALRGLVNGLMMTGFAMQAARTSRPASGADHQFSHLWDMQHHTHHGLAPSHGFKVGIGTLASVALYEELLRRDLASLDVEQAASRWPALDELYARIDSLFEDSELRDKAREETAAKYAPTTEVRHMLIRLQSVWPTLCARLLKHLIPLRQLQTMLREAGCPTLPEEIGISRNRLRVSYEQALFIRRRFTVLDLAHRAGLLSECLDNLFGSKGVWNMSRLARPSEA